jgi:tetratricopeptide (TPR) repeat protein
VIFLAGLLADPTPLIERALAIDPLLAFEIVRDAPEAVPAKVTRQLAHKLWSNATARGGAIGTNRRWALLFKRLAVLLKKAVETLALNVASYEDQESLTADLLSFYMELNDAQAQQRLLAYTRKGGNVPEALLFEAAYSADASGHHERAIMLYTRYLEREPSSTAALNNRALCYEELGRIEEALENYQRAIALDAASYTHTNYAELLCGLDRTDEAFTQLHLALQKDHTYAPAHSLLGDLLAHEDPETSLLHYEQAVQYAKHDEDLRAYLPPLIRLQEQLGRYAGAIRSLRQLIALEPTSSEVQSWKQRIAACRQAIDAEIRTRSVREQLQEQGELPLPKLVGEWLKAAGWQVEHATSSWMLARGRRDGMGTLPIVLMPEPRVTAAGLRAALDAVRSQAWHTRRIVVVTAAETLELEARHQWAALQDELTLGLIEAVEIRGALLQSDVECSGLLNRVLDRSGYLADPFDYKGVVQHPTEFFGREAVIADIMARLSRGRQVGLYGIHKIGKSSLIKQLLRNLRISHPEITVIPIELDGHDAGPGNFYCRVLEQLPGVTDLPAPQFITATDFRRTLRAYHQRRVQERPSHRVLLVVDEYAFLIPDVQGKGGMPGFHEVLGVLKTCHQEGWLILLPCGRTAALNRQASWGSYENPFIDLLHPCFLGPLSRDENDALMTTLGRRAKLTFTPEALAAIYAETAGHPSFSRSLGSQILRAVNGSGEVTAACVHTAVQAFLRNQDQTTILRAIYGMRMDEDERRIAGLLAAHGPQPRTALFPGEADRTRRRHIRDAIDTLLDTSVLVERIDGTIDHCYGLLRRHIQQEAEELGMVE